MFSGGLRITKFFVSGNGWRSFHLSIPDTGKKALYAWGNTSTGALGTTRSTSKVDLLPLKHEFTDNNVVEDFRCGYGFSILAIESTQKEKTFAAGVNTDFQVTGSEKGSCIINIPKLVNLNMKNCDTKVVSLSAGRGHSAVVTDKEGVFMFGSNAFGQCGRNITEADLCEITPQVNNVTDFKGESVKSVACGTDHTIFLTKSGKMLACGFSAEGQTGLDTTDNVTCPCMIKGPVECEVVVKVSSKGDSNLALTANGQVFGWGSNEYLQVCDDAKTGQVNVPKLICLSSVGKVVDIACGSACSMVLNDKGEVFVWGFGILGNCNKVIKCGQPINLNKTLFGSGCNPKVVAIECGVSSLMAINSSGELFAWGGNRFGSLGIGHNRPQFFPMKVPIKEKVCKVACGLDHALALAESC